MLRILQPLLQEDDGLDISSNNQDVADPGQSQAAEGEKELETPEPTTEKPIQTSDENSKYAAARREAEAEVKALKEKDLRRAIALGYDSVEEYDEAIEQRAIDLEEERKAEVIEKFGYDPEELIEKAVDKKIQSDPRFIELQNKAYNEKANAAIEALNREFKLGLISSIELDSIENAEKVTKLVMAGFDVVEAYKMANHESLNRAKAVKDAKQASDSGRMELGGIDGIPNPETVSVPNDVAEPLRRQGWDDDKILKHYKLLQKNMK